MATLRPRQAQKNYLEFFRNLDDWSVGPDDAKCLERLRILVEEREGYHLFHCIEDAKKDLSENEIALVNYEYPGISLELPLDRTQFVSLSATLVEAIMKSLDATVKQAGIVYKDIDIVCCTGGTARLGAIQSALAERLGQEKLRQHLPLHAVINGLAEKVLQMLRA